MTCSDRRPTSPDDRTSKLTVSIPTRLRQELRAAAVADTRTVSNFVTLLIVEGLAARTPTRSTHTLPSRNAPSEVE